MNTVLSAFLPGLEPAASSLSGESWEDTADHCSIDVEADLLVDAPVSIGPAGRKARKSPEWKLQAFRPSAHAFWQYDCPWRVYDLHRTSVLRYPVVLSIGS